MHNINEAYHEQENANKRLRLSLSQTRAKDAKTIASLQAEIAALRTSNNKLTESNEILALGVEAYKATEITATQTLASSAVEIRALTEKHEQYRQIVEGRYATLQNRFNRRVTEAQRDADKEIQELKERLETADKPRIKLEEELRKQKVRVVEAEAKLSFISAYIGAQV